MEPFTMGALAAQGGLGLIKTVGGLFGNAKANADGRKNIRPNYYIPKPVFDNQSISEARASKGLSDSSLEAYRTGTQRTTSASLNAILQNGGDLNHIGDVYTAGENGVSKMSIIDDEMKARNIGNLLNQNNEMAGYLDKEWQINKYAPWADKQQEIAQRKANSNALMMKGLSDIGSAAANYATGKLYKKEGDAVFGQKQEDEGDDTGNENRTGNVGRAALDDLDNYLGKSSYSPARANPANVGSSYIRNLYPGLR
jgi:hypothetical protein